MEVQRIEKCNSKSSLKDDPDYQALAKNVAKQSTDRDIAMIENEFYTTKNVAEKLKISVQTVKNLVKRGNLQAIKIGSAKHAEYRISQDAFDNFIKKSTIETKKNNLLEFVKNDPLFIAAKIKIQHREGVNDGHNDDDIATLLFENDVLDNCALDPDSIEFQQLRELQQDISKRDLTIDNYAASESFTIIDLNAVGTDEKNGTQITDFYITVHITLGKIQHIIETETLERTDKLHAYYGYEMSFQENVDYLTDEQQKTVIDYVEDIANGVLNDALATV